MGFEVKSAKLVAEPGREIWGQAVSFKDLFVVVELEGETQVVSKGKEILDQVFSLYQELKPKNLQTLKKIKEKIRAGEGFSLNLILGFLADNALYLSCIGKGVVIVKRREKTAIVLKGQGEASGVLKEGDLIVFSSPKFNKTIPPESLRGFFDDLEAEDIAEKLAPFLHENDEAKGAAALIIKTYPEKILEKVKEEEKEREEQGFADEKEFGGQGKIEILAKFLKKLGRRERFKIKERREKVSRKTLSTVVIFLTLLLGISIFLGIKKKEKVFQQTKFDRVFTIAQHKYEEGEALLDLNPARARALLSEAKASLEEIRNDFKKGSWQDKKIKELYEKIKADLGLAARAYKLEKLPLFFDLSLIKKGASGERIALYKDTVVVLDKKNKVIYKVSIKTKAQETVAGGDKLKDSIDISLHGDKVFILTQEGILVVNMQSKNLNLAVEREEKWGEVKDLVSYAGNLYLLDIKNNQIWKYISTESGFSKIRSYLGPKVSPQFGEGKNLAIDGSIWVLTPKEILKFTRGGPDFFKIKGLEEELTSPDYLFTNDESKNLYVLEKEKERIVVFDKDGIYQAQYFHEEIGKASEMVVSEGQKKIFLLVKNKIYGIEIE